MSTTPTRVRHEPIEGDEALELDGVEPGEAVPEAPAARASTPTPPAPKPKAATKQPLLDRVEAFLSRLSTRNHFWHRVCSLIWLPYAFRSGIRMKRVDEKTFSATLPFRRFNRNWYNAMAGAALLGNSEIAGGAYVFGECGGDYEVVCKRLEYDFLRPCFGPAEYRISPREDMGELIATGEEFNLTVDMEIVQLLPTLTGRKGDKKSAKKSAKRGRDRIVGREKRVGRCTAIFHVTPKTHQKAKRRRG
ncbi:MAG: hypothetical protein R3B57_12340 [Phycisphaerales bacterium]